ncbi:MAG: hypothetical protein GF410_01830 [Chitinivibrionales bacterium]|nr:hypothetical protein [Chitinivibrionales bacterium]
MAKLTPAEFREKLQRRLKQSQTDIQNGVNRVSVSPTSQAAKKLDKMRQRWIDAMDSGKIQRGLNRVSVESWKEMMLQKGVPRISEGIDRAGPKIEAFAEEILPYIDKARAELDTMPDVTLEDNIQRMSSFVRKMAEFKRKG